MDESTRELWGDTPEWVQEELDKALAVPEATSSFTLVALPQSASVNPGDELHIPLFICGYGLPDRHKLTVYHHHPDIFDGAHGAAVSPVNGIVDSEENEIRQIILGKEAFRQDMAETIQFHAVGTTFGVPDVFFVDDITWGRNMETPENQIEGAEEILPRLFPRTTAEAMTPDGEYPLLLTFDIDEDAEPGDYDIHLIFTYGDEEEVSNCHKIETIHVNSRRERLEPWPTRIAMLAGIAAVLSLIYNTGVISAIIEAVLGLL
ncbi:hypothetical protein [Haloarchaeobius litoreus]|uniref:DUF8164 domain-containing protein n=1 Tax=Haloarchaeobius litoreus TaxID=755306 RepID=A0ABD6DEA1_9EURY|nr:hypothetical protein [Haloarchaeobius litoreus]